MSFKVGDLIYWPDAHDKTPCKILEITGYHRATVLNHGEIIKDIPLNKESGNFLNAKLYKAFKQINHPNTWIFK